MTPATIKPAKALSQKQRNQFPFTVYLILVDGEPVYIGQTKKDLKTRLSAHRWNSKLHKSFFGDFLNEAVEQGKDIKIHPLSFADTLTSALKAEDHYIERYTEAGIQLFNRKVNNKYSLDSKRRMSASHRGQSTVKQPVYCPETGVLFPSISAAARAYAMSVGSICNAIKHQCRNHGLHFMRVG